MHYAVIAAGNGSRLVKEGITTPKPLVKINGEPLIDRLIRIFVQNRAESISIILNSGMPTLVEHVDNVKTDVDINVINKSTPSSMHSFYELSKFLHGRFCLTTVDTVFREDDFASFIKTVEKETHYDGILGVTDYIDDEKPLYVSTSKEMDITGFYDTDLYGIRYISGGIYALSPKCLITLNKAISEGVSRMRNYQRRLIEDGMLLHAYEFSKIIDIDHASDIITAEKFLNYK